MMNPLAMDSLHSDRGNRLLFEPMHPCGLTAKIRSRTGSRADASTARTTPFLAPRTIASPLGVPDQGG
jgi:hypothetical protein